MPDKQAASREGIRRFCLLHTVWNGAYPVIFFVDGIRPMVSSEDGEEVALAVVGTHIGVSGAIVIEFSVSHNHIAIQIQIVPMHTTVSSCEHQSDTEIVSLRFITDIFCLAEDGKQTVYRIGIINIGKGLSIHFQGGRRQLRDGKIIG